MGRQVVLEVKERVRSEYAQSSAGNLPEVVQSVVTADEGSLVLIRSGVFIILQLQEL